MSETDLENNMSVRSPVFLLCTGVTAAGCTTSLFSIAKTGLAQFAPSQFTTRKLRPNEISGEQFYSVSREKLKYLQPKIAIQDEYCGNIYGMFRRPQQKIHEILKHTSIVIDAIHVPNKWRELLGETCSVRSAFFAPERPEISLDRIAIRAEQTREVLAPDFIEKRRVADAEHIQKIWEYDYWVDTTSFLNIVPALQLLLTKQYNQLLSGCIVHDISFQKERIHTLLHAYSA